MRKILVGVDGSEHSKRALGEAIKKIAEKFGAEVTVDRSIGWPSALIVVGLRKLN